MANKILIKNATFSPHSEESPKDILIESGRIKKIAPSIPLPSGCEEIDASGLTVIPGLVDVHVHLREPGFSYKETIASGTRAAAAGGFTTVCAMPNLTPAPDSLAHLKKELVLIKRDACIEVLPYATITKGRLGKEPVNFKELAPYVAGFSDDGSGVQDSEVMQRAMEEEMPTDKVIAAHCEVNSLLEGGYIHKGEYARLHDHKGISSQSEWQEVKRDIELAERTGCRLHICHISTAESVDLIRRGKARGVKVTCETAPHYLIFSDEDLLDEGRFKMNPPIRSKSDRDALIAGVADGTIDVIATDHAPHSEEDKSHGLAKSAMGVVGLETSLAAIYTYLVKPGIITFERMLELMAIAPREIFKISGGINEGDRADLAIVNFDKQFIVDSNNFHSKGKSSPFTGMKMQGKVIMTIANGKVVHSPSRHSTGKERHKEHIFTVLENERLTLKTWRMTLAGDTSDFTTPGQFVEVAVPGKYLRRPISVCDYSNGQLTLLYDVVGAGTATMAEMDPGTKVNLLTGLGNGFNVKSDLTSPLLIGGGIGTAPLLKLARELSDRCIFGTVALGFNSKTDILLEEEFRALGHNVVVSTVDGSAGTKGFVTDAIAKNNIKYDYFYACGPLPMLRAVSEGLDKPGEISLEARMACGFGICMCCAMETKNGMKGVCKDGPVFAKEDIIWK